MGGGAGQLVALHPGKGEEVGHPFHLLEYQMVKVGGQI